MLIAGRNTYICYHNPVYIVIVVWMHGYAIMRSPDDIVALLTYPKFLNSWMKLFIIYLDISR